MNDLSQKDHDSTSERQETQLNSALLCSLVQIARVVIVRVIVDVIGVMVDVLIGRHRCCTIHVAIFVVIFCNWRCTLYNSPGTTNGTKFPVLQRV